MFHMFHNFSILYKKKLYIYIYIYKVIYRGKGKKMWNMWNICANQIMVLFSGVRSCGTLVEHLWNMWNMWNMWKDS